MTATLALIAHDRKKDELVDFILQYQAIFARYRLIATETTGQHIQQGTNLPIEQMLSGQQGGDIQIAAQVAEGKILAVIFLIDPLFPQLHEPDIQVLQRICAIHNVPLAINIATAEAILEKLRHSRVAHLIFNPVAGSGNANQDLSLIRQLLKPHMHLRVYQTTPDESAEELTIKVIETHPDLIIASGGDGTISAVAGTLIGTKIPLGIIPRGTANAFAVALGIPLALTPIRSACQVIINGNTRVVDAAYCNQKPMILLAGIGYEAETIDKASREMKEKWGALAYLIAGWQQLHEQEIFEAEIEIDHEVFQLTSAAITIANAAPPTSILAQGKGEVIFDDHLLDVTIGTINTNPQQLVNNPKLQAVTTMINMLGAALIKTSPELPNIYHLRTPRIKVTANPPQKVVVDGEMIGTTPVEIECIPDGLIVFVPGNNDSPK
ncbi:methylglyoxal synthase [Lyngbya sp. PCC 8106]|uniref:methylglyoxal synthase n=1 Tax=Lyngbya sp. (strain PCC 8106) TaxID=313612 RepID=UPI0000EAC5AD|nr:methylglyoxal synthase [Lyngbya sp. PCC 8106]EAW38471.1 methylglyoxal synthase [Lyngbya sp. PCC 8106]